MLAAGLKGIENSYELPDEVSEDVDAMSAEDREAKGIGSLPDDLSVALREMERSELVAEALGEHVFEQFLRNKRAEWDSYKAYVSPFELERYMPVL
jgi:glutamine synthetase